MYIDIRYLYDWHPRFTKELTKDQYMLLSLRNNLHPGNRKSPSGTEKQNNLGNFGLYQPNTSHGKNNGVSDITEKNNTDPHRK